MKSEKCSCGFRNRKPGHEKGPHHNASSVFVTGAAALKRARATARHGVKTNVPKK